MAVTDFFISSVTVMPALGRSFVMHIIRLYNGIGICIISDIDSVRHPFGA